MDGDGGFDAVDRQIRATLKRVARSLPSHADLDDLYQEGWIGWIEAKKRHDHRLSSLRTYTDHRVRGAMRDMMRSQDFVPRSTRKLRSRYERAKRLVEQRTGAPASVEDVADAMGMTVDRIHDVCGERIAADWPVRLDRPTQTEEGELSKHEMIDGQAARPDDNAMRSEVMERLRLEVARLPGLESQVVEQYYFEGRHLIEIGEQLGFSESRACQLLAKAQKRLQPRLRFLMDDTAPPPIDLPKPPAAQRANGSAAPPSALDDPLTPLQRAVWEKHKAYPDWGTKRLAKALGRNPSSVYAALAAARRHLGQPEKGGAVLKGGRPKRGTDLDVALEALEAELSAIDHRRQKLLTAIEAIRGLR